MTNPRSSIEDFAFADTIATRDLDDLPPPSGPIIVSDPFGHTHQMTPIVYPIPVDDRRSIDTLRRGFSASVAEMRELWSATLHVVKEREVETPAPPISPVERSLVVFRRMRALWAFWQWERADMVRAAMIGTAVFLAAALVWFASASLLR